MNLIKPIYATICNPLLENCDEIASTGIAANPQTYTNRVLQTIISIFFLVAVIYFIWHFVMSAYHMISSQGDPKKWEEAQKSIIYSFVGVLLVFSVFVILKFAGIVLGIPGLENLQITWPSLAPTP